MPHLRNLHPYFKSSVFLCLIRPGYRVSDFKVMLKEPDNQGSFNEIEVKVHVVEDHLYLYEHSDYKYVILERCVGRPGEYIFHHDTGERYLLTIQGESNFTQKFALDIENTWAKMVVERMMLHAE